MVYVDDIFCGSPFSSAAERLQKMLKEIVAKAKITGSIPAGGEGRVTFLGREVLRLKAEPNRLYVRIPPEYLEELTRELKPSYDPPQLDGLKESESEALGPKDAHRVSIVSWTTGMVDPNEGGFLEVCFDLGDRAADTVEMP